MKQHDERKFLEDVDPSDTSELGVEPTQRIEIVI
jgi:hypothetical protein